MECILTVAQAPESDSRQVVERFLEAFNRHDVEAMLALAHADVQWLTVDGDKISVDTAGQAALTVYEVQEWKVRRIWYYQPVIP